MKLEILTNTLNSIAGKLILPALVLGGIVLAATSTGMLIRFESHQDKHGCSYCLSWILAMFAGSVWFGGFIMFRQLEKFTQESDEVLREIDSDIMRETRLLGHVLGRHFKGAAFQKRSFRRRIMRVQLGDFGYIEPGFALSFFQQTLDNIVTYVFMVKVGGEMWLF